VVVKEDDGKDSSTQLPVQQNASADKTSDLNGNEADEESGESDTVP
jgi:hypothetical protein